MGLFDSLANLVGNVATVVVKPVEVAVDLTNAAVKPIAETAEEIAQSVKDMTK